MGNDNNKETLEYVVGLSKANTYEIGGVTFTDKNLTQVNPLIHYPSITPLRVATLNGIITYVEKIKDILPEDFDIKDCVLHIVSPTCVKLTTLLLLNGERIVLVTSSQDVNLVTNKYQEIEEFLIETETLFADNKDKTALLALVSSIRDVGENIVDDNGISQNLTVKKSIGFSDSVQGKNRFTLKPFRTFLEVDQPTSEYLFRVKKINEKINAQLFFIENYIWRLEAIKNIKNYFIDTERWNLEIPILA